MQEEIFGPVLPVLTYTDLEEAMELAAPYVGEETVILSLLNGGHQ